jgi:hypothetical protein
MIKRNWMTNEEIYRIRAREKERQITCVKCATKII